MAETYSLAITGAAADNDLTASPNQANNPIDVGDSVARPGAAANAMSDGLPFLCRGPDGSQAWYTYDAERSIIGSTLYLKKVT